jgi:hypothetical protein
VGGRELSFEPQPETAVPSGVPELSLEPESMDTLDGLPVLEATPALDDLPILEAEPAAEPSPKVIVDPEVLARPPEEGQMLVDESEFVPALGSRAPATPPVISGEQRVIVHMVEGAVKRGVLRDVDLGAEAFQMEGQAGHVESVARSRVKAVFFMLPQGVPPPPIEGSKLRVTFSDGRQIVGFTSTYDPRAVGFFVIPADARTNTQRIYIFNSSVRNVVQG